MSAIIALFFIIIIISISPEIEVIFVYHVTQSKSRRNNLLIRMLTTQDKHNLFCQRVARLQVSQAQDVDLGVSV